jgi:hypothetical protein
MQRTCRRLDGPESQTSLLRSVVLMPLRGTILLFSFYFYVLIFIVFIVVFNFFIVHFVINFVLIYIFCFSSVSLVHNEN